LLEVVKEVKRPDVDRGSKIASVHQAIPVPGINLLNHVALLQTMEGKPPKVPRISQDDAYITGQFHDCGIPVLMCIFPDYRKMMVANARMDKHALRTRSAPPSTPWPAA
jgi:hypothetical protein